MREGIGRDLGLVVGWRTPPLGRPGHPHPDPLPPRDLCTTHMDGYCWRLSSRDPPLSFGHFPRERGKPWYFAKVSPSGRGKFVHIATMFGCCRRGASEGGLMAI